MRGCATAISSFANIHIDSIFTVVFGIVGMSLIQPPPIPLEIES